jgi:hypothetical protein
MARGALVVTALALAGCGEDAVPIPPECNGAIELCERRYDEVVYPTTHNAMSNQADGWTYPNQYLGIARQLDDGVRGLMLDTHQYDGQIQLCHSLCPLGNLPLVDGLDLIRDFLERNRGEVVTIIFEAHTDAEAHAEAFAAAGLERLVHTQAADEPWPTLRELIDADRRLVVFTDDDGVGAYGWYMNVWTHAWETPFAARTVDDFTCDPGRGDPENRLFIFNHFLTETFAVPEEAPAVNANPFLIDRARACMDASGSLPNFVTVDFYSVGDLFEAVRMLNGL